MLCVRHHLIFDKQYRIFENEDCLTIGTNEFNTKYIIKFDISTKVDWLVSSSKKKQIEAFGLKYKGQQKWFHMNPNDIVQLFEKLRIHVTYTNIQNIYQPINILGEGASSKVIYPKIQKYLKVFLVQNTLTKRYFANKCVRKNNIEKLKQLKSLQQEVEFLKFMNHPNIIKFQEFYDCDIFFHLITEYVDGENLSTYIRSTKYDNIPNETIKSIMHQLLDALVYLDKNHIIHRDIKPENIIIQEQNDSPKIKLLDFGFATHAYLSSFQNPKCGTPGYIAPEVANLPNKNITYTSKCDIFSAGSIFYKLITGRSLFQGEDAQMVYNLNKKCKFNLEILKIFTNVPDSAKDLLNKMLCINPEERITALQALQHEYFKDYSPTTISTFLKFQSILDCKKIKSKKTSQTSFFSDLCIPSAEGNKADLKIPKISAFNAKIKNQSKQEENIL